MLLPTFIRWSFGRIGGLFSTIALTLVLGEILMRIGLVLPAIRYDKSNPKVPFVTPNQRAVMYVGNATYRCPGITINSDGLRGPEIDWSKKVILWLGSSEAMGVGVRDYETSTAWLQNAIDEKYPESNVTIANAGLAGFGPYHQTVLLERLAKQHPIHAAVVRITIGDATLLPKTILTRWQFVNLLREHSCIFSTLSRRSKGQFDLARAVDFNINKPAVGKVSEFFSEDVGKRRYVRQREHWERMFEVAKAHHIPLLLVFVNPRNTGSDQMLEVGLRSASARQAGVALAIIPPGSFELESMSVDAAHSEYMRRWTIRCDPHANAAQHALVAQQVFRFLQQLSWLKP